MGHICTKVFIFYQKFMYTCQFYIFIWQPVMGSYNKENCCSGLSGQRGVGEIQYEIGLENQIELNEWELFIWLSSLTFVSDGRTLESSVSAHAIYRKSDVHSNLCLLVILLIVMFEEVASRRNKFGRQVAPASIQINFTKAHTRTMIIERERRK